MINKSITNMAKLTCPITRQLINQIAITSDGFYYEKFAINKWLCSNNVSPLTGLAIGKKTYPCVILQNQLDDFYKRNPQFKSKRFELPTSHAENVKSINKLISTNRLEKLLNYNEFSLRLFGVSKIIKILKSNGPVVIQHVINNTRDLECIINKRIGERLIHYACQLGSTDAIKLLVDSGVNLECGDNKKWRPIHYVCQFASTDAIKLLVDSGVNLECEDDEKWRPIHYACRFGS